MDGKQGREATDNHDDGDGDDEDEAAAGSSYGVRLFGISIMMIH